MLSTFDGAILSATIADRNMPLNMRGVQGLNGLPAISVAV